MDRVYGGDITSSVEPKLLPGCPPAGYHCTVVRREVHLQGSSAENDNEYTRTPQKHKSTNTLEYTSTEEHRYTKTQEQIHYRVSFLTGAP